MTNASDPLHAVEVAWAAELQNRADRVISGESAGIPWDQVHAAVTDKLSKD